MFLEARGIPEVALDVFSFALELFGLRASLSQEIHPDHKGHPYRDRKKATDRSKRVALQKLRH